MDSKTAGCVVKNSLGPSLEHTLLSETQPPMRSKSVLGHSRKRWDPTRATAQLMAGRFAQHLKLLHRRDMHLMLRCGALHRIMIRRMELTITTPSLANDPVGALT